MDKSRLTQEQLKIVEEAKEKCKKRIERDLYLSRYLNADNSYQKIEETSIYKCIEDVIESCLDDLSEIDDLYHIMMKMNSIYACIASVHFSKPILSVKNSDKVPQQIVGKYFKELQTNKFFQCFAGASVSYKIKLMELCERIDELEQRLEGEKK